MVRAGADQAVREVVALCHAGLDAVSLQSGLVDRLGRVLPVDAVFCSSVDPATLLFTSAVVRHIPAESARRFLANELLEEDVNKFKTLAGRRFPVEWLDRATGNRRPASARYREIMAPLGLGDELRAAFRSGGQIWGFMCLHREDASSGFTEAEARVVGRLAAHVGEGLRRALLVGTAATDGEELGPGVLVVDEDGSLVASTPTGERWLWELSGPGEEGGALPMAVQAVLARLAAITSGPDRFDVDVQPRARARTRSGRWAVVHASAMHGPGQHGNVALVVEPAQPAELAPMVLSAYGLTTREGDVARLVLQGKPTKVVARELRISQHTVEDHLKAVFTKVGVGSRGELTARIFSEHYAH